MNLKIPILGTLLILALAGTFVLTQKLDRSQNFASVFTGQGQIHEIALYADRAEPNTITISKGDEARFEIMDDGHHTIAEERDGHSDARLESGELRKGDSYSLTFLTKGMFSFYDRQNQDIRVTITVKD